MLLSEGEDEEEIHYSHTHTRARPNRALLFPHLHHQEAVRVAVSAVRPPTTALPLVTQVVRVWSDTLMHIAIAPTPTNALHSSEDAGIVEQLSPRETEGQRSVRCCFLDMDPALKGAAPTEHIHRKMTLSGWRGSGGGGTPTF